MNNPSDILKFFLSMTTEEFLAEFSLANDKMEEYSKKLAFFMEENDSKSITKLKGNALENLVVFLAQNTNLFEVIPNVRTSTNEIDALLRTKIQAKPLLEKHLDIGTDILFECKNYNQKVSVTWVGKFHSLLRHQSCKFGIIFSFHGFTGSKWNDAKGLTKKIYLRDKIMIIDFNFQDFNNLLSGKNFLKIIHDKMDTLKHDTIHEIETYCTEHEAEKVLSLSKIITKE